MLTKRRQNAEAEGQAHPEQADAHVGDGRGEHGATAAAEKSLLFFDFLKRFVVHSVGN